jgi:hypothetical protein
MSIQDHDAFEIKKITGNEGRNWLVDFECKNCQFGSKELRLYCSTYIVRKRSMDVIAAVNIKTPTCFLRPFIRNNIFCSIVAAKLTTPS